MYKFKLIIFLTIIIAVISITVSCSSSSTNSNINKTEAKADISEDNADTIVTTTTKEITTTEEIKATAKIKSIGGYNDKDTKIFEIESNEITGNFNNLYALVSTENFNSTKDDMSIVWYLDGEHIFDSTNVNKESENVYSMGIVSEVFIPNGEYEARLKLNGVEIETKNFRVSQVDLESINISGSGAKSTDFFEISGGLTVFDFSNNGEGNFIVMLLDENGEELDLLVNEIGTVKGKKATYLPNGKYFINVQNGGSWEFNILQPRNLERATIPYTFEGNFPDISKVIFADKLIQVDYTYSGEGNFIVMLLNEFGEQQDLLVNEIGNSVGSTTIKGNGNKYIISVQISDGNYTFNLNYK